MLEIKETKAIAPKLTNLKNDIFTHFLYHDPDDPNTFFFFKLVIEKFLHLQCIKIKVLNPQLSLYIRDDKSMTVDILAELQDGSLVNIEMQQAVSIADFIRFEHYGFELVVNQSKRGKDYSETNPVYQLIFLNDYDPRIHKLSSTYVRLEEDQLPYLGTNLYSTFVFIPYINDILKQKDLDQLSDEELYVNLLDKGLTHDILELENEVVIRMKEKVNQFNEDDLLRLAAFKREEYLKSERYKNKLNKEEGYSLGKEDGIVIGEAKGALEESKRKVIQLFNSFYPNEDISFLNDLNSSKYDLVFDALLKHKSLEELKELVK